METLSSHHIIFISETKIVAVVENAEETKSEKDLWKGFSSGRSKHGQKSIFLFVKTTRGGIISQIIHFQHTLRK